MSVVQTRGGVPHVFRVSAPTTGLRHQMPFMVNYIVARNQGANVVKMYFSEETFDDDTNFVLLPIAANTDPHGEWCGPVEVGVLWFKALVGASAIEVTGFQRRG